MTSLLILALLLYFVGIALAFPFANERLKARAPLWLGLSVGVGFAAHTTSLLASWSKLGHFPIVNFKEVCSFIAWALAAYYLLAIQRYKARALPIFVLSCASVLLILSLHLPTPTAPVSHSLLIALSDSSLAQIILPIHVALLLFAYAAFVVTVGGGVMYLLQEHELKAKHFGAVFRGLPALNTCDDISHRAMTIGFVALTLGMVAGMIWGKQHDGRFWHNDPKEVLALVTWVVYLAMAHYRLTAGWRGRRVAWLAIGGFVAVLLTFIGARAMGGYHVFG